MQGEEIAGYMFSGEKIEKFDDREPEVLMPLAENPRVKQLAGKERFGIDADGKKVSKVKAYALRDGLFEAMIHRFYIDPTMVAYGEENRDWGGAFAVYRGLTEALPYHRLFNSSISEGAIVGSGVGYALSGGRAVVELMYNDFMGRAGDEIFNQMAKWQSMSAGVPQDAPGGPRFRRQQVRRAALPGLVKHHFPHPGSQSLFPRDSLRRKRDAQPGPCRQ
jgi:2-oxoisovalerate dehydrogenase E1 component